LEVLIKEIVDILKKINTKYMKNKMNFKRIMLMIDKNIRSLNNSKFFAGIVMIVLNIGSRFISVKFSKSTEEYIKYGITKQILVFSMSWMASRDIYISLTLTAIFTVLSELLFNEESKLCIVPQKYRLLNKIIDENNDGEVDETELNNAIKLLEKAKNKQEQNSRKIAMAKFEIGKI